LLRLPQPQHPGVQSKAVKFQTGPNSHAHIPPGKQRFELRYTGLSFAAPDKVRFKYRLEGLEKEWVEAGRERFAQYSYLRPGDYTFQVGGQVEQLVRGLEHPGPRRAHAHLGGTRLGLAVFLVLGPVQLTLASVSPYLHVGAGAGSRVRLALRAGASGR